MGRAVDSVVFSCAASHFSRDLGLSFVCICAHVCVYVFINVCANAHGDLVLGMDSITYDLKLNELTSSSHGASRL